MITKEICDLYQYTWDETKQQCTKEFEDGVYICISGYPQDHPYDAMESLLGEFHRTQHIILHDRDKPGDVIYWQEGRTAGDDEEYDLHAMIHKVRQGVSMIFGTAGRTYNGVMSYIEGHISRIENGKFIAHGTTNITKIE